MNLLSWPAIQCKVKYVPVDASEGTITIASGMGNKRIVLVQAALTSVGECSFRFKGSVSGNLCGLMRLYANPLGVISASNANLVLPFSPAGWMQTSSGEDLQLEVTGDDLAGMVAYIPSPL